MDDGCASSGGEVALVVVVVVVVVAVMVVTTSAVSDGHWSLYQVTFQTQPEKPGQTQDGWHRQGRQEEGRGGRNNHHNQIEAVADIETGG